MQEFMKYKLLILGIVVILAASFLMAYADSKQADCESIGGEILKLFDAKTKQDCSEVRTITFLAYAGLAIGIAMAASNFVKRK
jgi:hypothetical protein